MIPFGREIITEELIEELLPLLEYHHKEIMPYPDVVVNIDKEKYLTMEKLGLARCFIARDDGKIVGYNNFIVSEHIHYRQHVQALCDVMFIDPKFRNGTGMKFIKWCDKQLFEEGVSEIHYTVQAKLDYSSILERMGYIQHARVFTKRR